MDPGARPPRPSVDSPPPALFFSIFSRIFWHLFFDYFQDRFLAPTWPPKPLKIDQKSMPRCLPFSIPFFDRFLIVFGTQLRPLKTPKSLIFHWFFKVFLLFGLFKLMSTFGPKWIASWVHFGSIRACFAAMLAPSRAILAPSWHHLASSWAILGPSWAILVPSWAILGLSWGHLLAILGHLGLA